MTACISPEARDFVDAHFVEVAGRLEAAGWEPAAAATEVARLRAAFEAELTESGDLVDLEDAAFLLGTAAPGAEVGPPSGTRDDAVGMLAFAFGVGTVPVALVVGSLPGAPEEIGGATLMTGAAIGLVLGVFARRHRLGRVGLALSALLVALLALSFAM